MDENQYADSIFHAPPEMEVSKYKYTLFCKRSNKRTAELIRDDLVTQGKRAIITDYDGGFAVWWA